MKSKKISRSAKDTLSAEDFKPENVKANITIRISADLLGAYRAEAARLGIGYQTLMQLKLREALGNPLEKRLEKVERALKRKAG